VALALSSGSFHFSMSRCRADSSPRATRPSHAASSSAGGAAGVSSVATTASTCHHRGTHPTGKIDDNALIGEAVDVSRFLYATGFSGHGFLQAPAVGEIVRDLVLGAPPFVDVSPLGVERFALSAPRPEHNVI